MYFLDANAFYSYYGRSKIGMSSAPVNESALISLLDRHQKKGLPTSVFIEIVTHFRDNPLVLNDLLHFRYIKHMPLYNNIPDYVVDENEITAVHYMRETELKSYAMKVLERKIKIEVKFTKMFFDITRSLYAHYRLNEAFASNLDDSKMDNFLRFLVKDLFKEGAEDFQNRLQSELENGYSNADEKRIHKNFYIDELGKACSVIDIWISGIKAYMKNDDDIISAMQTGYQEVKSRGLDCADSTMHSIVDTLSQDTVFLNTAKSKIANMFSKGHYSKTQIAYIRDIMFPAWFERGQKLQKNDIFDMLCLGCLDYHEKLKPENVLIDNSSYIITFDERMKQFIGNVKPSNLALINNI